MWERRDRTVYTTMRDNQLLLTYRGVELDYPHCILPILHQTVEVGIGQRFNFYANEAVKIPNLRRMQWKRGTGIRGFYTRVSNSVPDEGSPVRQPYAFIRRAYYSYLLFAYHE